jgi:hypothetical protein
MINAKARRLGILSHTDQSVGCVHHEGSK